MKKRMQDSLFCVLIWAFPAEIVLSRQTKSDACLIPVKILDSIFINYIIRSKQGELSQSHFARNRENREIYIPTKYSRPTVLYVCISI